MDNFIIPATVQEAADIFRTAKLEEGGMVLVSICDRGGYTIKINGRKRHIGTSDILIVPHGESIGSFKTDSDDTDAKFFCISTSLFLKNIRSGRNVWLIFMYARNNPVFHLSASDRELTSSYHAVIKGKLATPKGYYYDEILSSILQCVIYEICVIINRDILTAEENVGSEKRKDLIFKKFIELLSKSDGCRRSVQSFADELCITPKYLSSVSVDICGKSAHALILDNVVSQIRSELDFSDKGIKELSDQFGFPNLSAFGNFVKTRLGVSPREYRNGKKSPIQ